MKNKKHVCSTGDTWSEHLARLKEEIKPQHTPTPWGYESLKERFTLEGDGLKIGNIKIEANTAYIVKAVNCHEELVAFINACLDCKSADELMDFVQNNAEDVITKTEAK